MSISNLQVVWYKRDLRIADHRPLVEAARRGPVLPLYICEPSVMQADDFSAVHWAFLRDSLQALRENLAALGQPLVVRRGEAVPTFQRLYDATGGFALWAHQETGTRITFDRDRAVLDWARAHDVPVTEHRQNGVVRGSHDRDDWSSQWHALMNRDLLPPPEVLQPVPVRPGPIPTAEDLGLAPTPADVQAGGEGEAERVLHSFLHDRGRRYTREMSSPVTAYDACSRISPHVAWGTMSLRTAYHRVQARQKALQGRSGTAAKDWGRACSSFESRLHWHDHFMQKLEDAPRIEHESFIPAFDALREDAHDPDRESAWAAGETGYPLVDASMRALQATGWLNFRMRAMVTSFASYDLWLDWRQFHDVLARRWVDYQPGIHFSQLQMQSGTTGINTIRVYNPTKQAREQDPAGDFIRRWVPELDGVQDAYVHTPWLMPANAQQRAGCVIGKDYPAPLVNHDQAAKRARQEIHRLRKRPDVRARARGVLDDHGSRRGSRSTSTRPADGPDGKEGQGSLF